MITAQQHRAASLVARRFIDDFEAGRIPPQDFHHREHVRLAWSHLSCHSPAETLDLLPRAIRRFAAEHDVPGLYHETITWAYVLIIHERMEDTRARDSGATPSFEEFAAVHGDLFEWPSPILQRSYDAETIWSERARNGFVWPDGAGA